MEQITKEQISKLGTGDKISSPAFDAKYIQRLRNYCNNLKSENIDFTVRTKSGIVTVTCLEPIDRDSLTQKLRSMEPGDIIHPCSSRKIAIVSGTVAGLGGGYKVRSVVEVEKE